MKPTRRTKLEVQKSERRLLVAFTGFVVGFFALFLYTGNLLVDSRQALVTANHNTSTAVQEAATWYNKYLSLNEELYHKDREMSRYDDLIQEVKDLKICKKKRKKATNKTK